VNDQAIKTAVIMIIAGAVIAGVLFIRQANSEPVTMTCYDKLAELDRVALIANATGRLPGDPKYHSEAKFSVKPEVCK